MYASVQVPLTVEQRKCLKQVRYMAYVLSVMSQLGKMVHAGPAAPLNWARASLQTSSGLECNIAVPLLWPCNRFRSLRHVRWGSAVQASDTSRWIA